MGLAAAKIRREGEQCHRRQDTQPATRPNRTQQKRSPEIKKADEETQRDYVR